MPQTSSQRTKALRQPRDDDLFSQYQPLRRCQVSNKLFLSCCPSVPAVPAPVVCDECRLAHSAKSRTRLERRVSVAAFCQLVAASHGPIPPSRFLAARRAALRSQGIGGWSRMGQSDAAPLRSRELRHGGDLAPLERLLDSSALTGHGLASLSAINFGRRSPRAL